MSTSFLDDMAQWTMDTDIPTDEEDLNKGFQFLDSAFSELFEFSRALQFSIEDDAETQDSQGKSDVSKLYYALCCKMARAAGSIASNPVYVLVARDRQDTSSLHLQPCPDEKTVEVLMGSSDGAIQSYCQKNAICGESLEILRVPFVCVHQLASELRICSKDDTEIRYSFLWRKDRENLGSVSFECSQVDDYLVPLTEVVLCPNLTPTH